MKMKKNIYVQFLRDFAWKKALLPLYFLMVIIIVATSAISLIRPQMQGKIVDTLSIPKSDDMHTLFLQLVAFLGMLLFSYSISYLQKYVISVISEEIAADMRQKLHDKLGTVKVEFFRKIELSDILLKIDKDVSAIKQCGMTSIITLISNIAILVVIPPYMFSIHKGIAISNILLLVFVPFVSRWHGKRIQKASKDVLDGYNDTTSVLTESYNNWLVTRLYHCYQYINRKYFAKSQEYKKAANKQNFIYILNTWMILLIQYMGTVIIWIVGALEIFEGRMTIGTIIALMNYQSIIMNPIIGIASFANEYHTAIVSLKDINTLLNFEDISGKEKCSTQKIEKIEFKNISFKFPDSEKDILHDLNLTLEKGKIYAIHGASGTGKSTLFSMLSDILYPTKGEILVNGKPLKDISPQYLWDRLGYVMQRSSFFKDSIIENICLEQEIPQETLLQYSKLMGLNEDIEALPQKWKSDIKTEPYNFSEGQLRRMDIIRNILKKNTDILIFDEATANIDEERRRAFYKIVHQLSKNKIILMATHNSAELNEADQIVDLEKLAVGLEDRL